MIDGVDDETEDVKPSTDHDNVSVKVEEDEAVGESAPSLRRSTRVKKKITKFEEEFNKLGHVAQRKRSYYCKRYNFLDKHKFHKFDRNKQFLMAMKWKGLVDAVKGSNLSALLHYMNQMTDQREGTIEDWHPAFLSSQANAADNPTWEEVMNGPDKEGY